jgi:hypothetical protein
MLKRLWLFSQLQPFNHLHYVGAIEVLAVCSSLEPFEWLCSEPSGVATTLMFHMNIVDSGTTEPEKFEAHQMVII